MMEYQNALATFLSASLAEKTERLVGFALSPKKKTQRKIIKLVYHELECILKPKLIVKSLTEKVWNYLIWATPSLMIRNLPETQWLIWVSGF